MAYTRIMGLNNGSMNNTGIANEAMMRDFTIAFALNISGEIYICAVFKSF